MKRLSFLLMLLGVFSLQSEAQIFTGAEADRKVKGAQTMRLESYSTVPTFLQFSSNSTLTIPEVENYLRKQFQLTNQFSLDIIQHKKEKNEDLYRYSQLYNGYKVEGAMFMAHSQNGKVTKLSGDVFTDLPVLPQPTISESMAWEIVTKAFEVKKYMWESGQTTTTAPLFHGPNRPLGTLVITPVAANYKQRDWRLAYKMDIFAVTPLLHKTVFVDAVSGEIIRQDEQLHSADVPATGTTRYSGTRNFVSDSFSGGFRLREAGRSGIETYDMNTDTDYANAVDFVDSDNVWDSIINMDEAARDAHWGAEMFYDYYDSLHNRNSIDDNGMRIISFVHYDVGYFNAFWNGQFATFGDGTANPLTTLDVVGHEFTHGVTGNSAQLIYQDEYGALNESFSDIFGTAIEFYARPNTADWIMASEFGPLNYIRSMSNPKAKNNPDTYNGDYWYTGAADNGGVHINSGVQNKWFYILTVGETGVNDLGDNYNVTGIGIIDAAKIAYRTLATYLTPTSEYIDARFYSIQSAIDIFGPCTPQVEATTNAWYAVGIGQPYQPTVIADFAAEDEQYCKVGDVTFFNLSNNAGTFLWNFGDGSPLVNTSTTTVTHNYTSFGNYTVTLIASGGACGTDTMVKPNYVSIDPSNPCTIIMNNTADIQTGCTGIVYDDGGEEMDYSANNTHMLTVSPAGAYKVDVQIELFEVSFTDTLVVYDGANANAPILGAYTQGGLAPGSTLSSTGGSLTFKFVTDGTYEDSGFVFTWKCQNATMLPQADFEANNVTTCDGKIQFTDLSLQASQWLWDFGDGTTSQQRNPIHEYQANGQYNVTLVATNVLGNDAEVKNQYITVNRPAKPTANPVYICGSATSATLTGIGSGTLIWEKDGNWIGEGNSITVTPTAADTFMVTDKIWQPSDFGGLLNNTGGNSFFYNNDSKYQIFDVLTPCVLRSVVVFAQTPGLRTVELRNQYGQVLQSRSQMLVQGANTFMLDFYLTPGNEFRLGINGMAALAYNNYAGVGYPFTINNKIKILKSNVQSLNYYFYFYNWEVADYPCVSPPKEVVVLTGGTPTVSAYTANQNLNNFIFDASSSLNAQMYLWDFGNGSTATGQTQPYTYMLAGNYDVRLITLNGGCADTTVQSFAINTISNIENGLGNPDFELLPNPNLGNFVLNFGNLYNNNFRILVLNELGVQIFEKNIEDVSEGKVDISLEKVPSGLYKVVLMNEKYLLSKSLIIN